MNANTRTEPALKPADLRGILRYVPLFRGHVFVISVDGSIIEHDNFANVLTDIAVLRSLNIQVVLVHGIGKQLKNLAQERAFEASDLYGDGPTDAPTLELALEATAQANRELLQGLARHNLKYAQANAVRAAQVGILHGKDYGATGRVDKVDLSLLRNLLEHEIVPVFSPIVYDRDGSALRLNSDLLAAELAIALEASKLIYLTPFPGLVVNGQTIVNIPHAELEERLARHAGTIDARLRSKATHAARALAANTPRTHILDGRVFGGLLTEIFDKVGLGTMIHANDYQQVRPARKKDVPALYDLMRQAVRAEALRMRTRQEIEHHIDEYFLYEIDDSLVACASLITYPRTKTMEVAAVFVQPAYQGKGIGKKMVDFARHEAARRGARKLVALSTQSFNFFHKVCAFREGSVKDLPAPRRKSYEASGRNSRILVTPVPPEKPAARTSA